jgi:DNA-directed RNA polymerase subunit RPC12/RpoP
MASNDSLPAPTVDESYNTRPDPDEPWRYACPECHSHRIRTNQNPHHHGALSRQPRSPGKGTETVPAPAYRCRQCSTALAEHDLIDKKEDSA